MALGSNPLTAMQKSKNARSAQHDKYSDKKKGGLTSNVHETAKMNFDHIDKKQTEAYNKQIREKAIKEKKQAIIILSGIGVIITISMIWIAFL